MAKKPDATTVATEDQLRESLRLNVQQTDMQNRVIRDMSKRLGSAGALIDGIGKIANGRYNDANCRKEILKLLAKFEAEPGRGSGAAKRS
ncbi:hypothetical protein VPHD148_0102 [Vibrio phage D148]